MKTAKRQRLEAAGWKVGDAADFLGLTPEESRLIELRIAVTRAVRRCREARGMTQAELAARMKSSQPRVAKVEGGAADVSLDLAFKALFAAGGGMADVKPVRRPTKVRATRPA